MNARILSDLQGRPGVFHMAADDMLARTLSESDFDVVVRFYRWLPPAVSLGFHQSPDMIDLDACAELGWDVVYRSTGGRALLHLDDLSYAVIIPAQSDTYRQLRELYESIALAIVRSLKQLRVNAEITKPSVIKGDAEPRLRAGICLDSRVRGEITVGGRKIVSAAQHIYRNSLLQHGSIMLDGDPGAIAKVSNVHETKRDILAEKLRNKACTLSDVTENDVDIKVLVDIIINNLADVTGLNIFKSDWNADEIERIRTLSHDFDAISGRVISRDLAG